MNKLDEIVEFYLTSDTNYAIMITGEWGVGKTHYFKNTLQQKISSTPVFSNNTKKYKPILISLFGLNSIEDVQTEIFLTLYPSLKSKTVKLGASVGKILVKGIMKLKGLGEFTDFVDNTKIDKKDWITLSELVICFDDVERLSKQLNLEELIGYINTLVENENVKVLIIANENKIEEENYAVLKEKVVGNSIEFIPDFNVSFDSLIESKFAAFSSYKNFLVTNREFILNVFTSESSNLRVLSFALSYFQTIYSKMSTDLPKSSILKKKQDEILLMLLKFSLVISIEYKLGKISFSKKEDLEHDGLDVWANLKLETFNTIDAKEGDEVHEKTYRAIFIDKYYKEDIYRYFNSIYDFLTGGSVFMFDELTHELENVYHIEKNKIARQYEVYNKLSYQAMFMLSESEYRKLTRELLSYSDKGEYNIQDYVTIFYFAARFDNPLRFNLDKLTERVIKGMQKGKSKYSYSDTLGMFISISEDSENKDNLLKIKQAILKVNDEIKSNDLTKESMRLEALCFADFQAFYTEILNRESQYYFLPVLEYFNAHKFQSFFMKSDNNTKWRIVRFWSNRYTDYPSSELKVERVFLQALLDKFKKKTKILCARGINGYIFRENLQALERSVKRLS